MRRASLAACKRITNKTGCHRAGGHGTSARDLNRNARTFSSGKLVSDARLNRHFEYSTWPAPNIRCVGFGRWLVYMLVGLILQRVMAYLRAI